MATPRRRGAPQRKFTYETNSGADIVAPACYNCCLVDPSDQKIESWTTDRGIFRRFWHYVQIGDECWEWTGGRSEGKPFFGGKGRCKPKGYANRIAYQILVGEIPSNRVVSMGCENQNCVRPEHVILKPRERQPTTCVIDNCLRIACRHGVCSMHWRRIQRHGNPDYRRGNAKSLGVRGLVDPKEIMWAAGFFDGEGSICAGLIQEKYWTLHLRVTQCNEESLRRFQKAVGGLGRVNGPYPQPKPWQSDFWDFTTSGAEAYAVAAMLYGFLCSAKKQQAMTALRTWTAYMRGQPPRQMRCEFCNRPVLARGFCSVHYQRWSNYGDPMYEPPNDGRQAQEKVG